MRNNHEKKDLGLNGAKVWESENNYGDKTFSGSLIVPANFRLLCAIWKVTPEVVLANFMDLSSFAPKEGATSKERRLAKDYLLACKYGQSEYTRKQVKQMFAELKANRLTQDSIEDEILEADKLGMRATDMKYKEFWFKKWFLKHNSIGKTSILDKF